jgi:hypothetical protein
MVHLKSGVEVSFSGIRSTLMRPAPAVPQQPIDDRLGAGFERLPVSLLVDKLADASETSKDGLYEFADGGVRGRLLLQIVQHGRVEEPERVVLGRLAQLVVLAQKRGPEGAGPRARRLVTKPKSLLE